MTLLIQRPVNRVFGRRFSDIMDEFFNDAVRTRQEEGYKPGIDVAETEKQYEIEIHLPGMKKEDISVDLENGVLSVSGERKMESEQKEKTFHKVETRYGSFKRSLQLPENIDSDSVKAGYEDGVLKITIDKDEEKVERKIQIS